MREKYIPVTPKMRPQTTKRWTHKEPSYRKEVEKGRAVPPTDGVCCTGKSHTAKEPVCNEHKLYTTTDPNSVDKNTYESPDNHPLDPDIPPSSP